MSVIQGLRAWWQHQTGEEETPFEGDATALLVSLGVHLVLVLALGLTCVPLNDRQVSLTITAPLDEDEAEFELPEEFYFSESPSEEIGANSVSGVDVAFSEAPLVSDVSDVPSPVDIVPSEVAQIEINETIELATGLHFNENLAVKGAAGEGTTGAVGAIDRITHEILLSLEERKTLVVWLFDQSGSLARQRQAIQDRFDRIYHELGVIEAAGNAAFKRHRDKPLLTAVYAFGNQVNPILESPTDNLAEIKQAVESIEQDDSGTERVFSAIYLAAKRFTNFRVPDEETGEPERNVMLIAITDEVGDDQDGLETTVKWCRRYAMPVYVIGVPAPFGRRETLVKWVDPDPQFDQTPQWGRVNQGPESFMPERIRLSLNGDREQPIDSGFGPFALTRLCYETGGIYFAVHPNRNVTREVSRGETEAFSAHLSNFFDPQVMRRYRPDYVSGDEYQRRAAQNKCRVALVQAARLSWVTPMQSPELRFVKRSEADLANAMSEAQKAAAKLEPQVGQLYEVMKLGEADRPRETAPRWQAGFDLAMGRVMAVKVRTEAYNAMLAKAKRGLKFEDEKNNTWVLKPSNDISVGSQLAKTAEKARMYLERVVEEHPGTPWALLASNELKTPLGWEWTEQFTDLSPNRGGAGGAGNPAPARNDARRMLPKGPPKRQPPRL